MNGRVAVALLFLAGCAHAPVEPSPVRVEPPPVVEAPPPVDPAVADAQAQAAFLVLETRFETQRAIALTQPQKLKAVLTLKKQGLRELEPRYVEITKLGSKQWAVAAEVRLAMLYEDLAQLLNTAPAPATLTPEQLDLYRSELHNVAVPIEARAAQGFRRAIALEGEEGPPSEWVTYARGHLPTAPR